MAPAPGSSSSTSTTRLLIFGLIAAVAVVATVVLLSPDPAAKSKSKKAAAEPAVAALQSPSKESKVVVEDDEESDEDDEEDGEAEVDEAELERKRQYDELAKSRKEEYDNLMSVADKCVKGNAYARAAENYTKALELAPLVPSVSRNILSIYNNRGAMYEKLGENDKSMNDIDVVLAMDPMHVKARLRRARVFEAKDALKEAMTEYVVVSFIDRHAGYGANIPGYDLKVSELGKLTSAKQAGPTLSAIRSAAALNQRNLPTNSFCRSFFEQLPVTHHWRAAHSDSASSQLGLDELSVRLSSTSKEASDGPEGKNKEQAVIKAALAVATCAISEGKFKHAFKTLASAKAAHASHSTDASACALEPALALQLNFLCGVEEHLRCNPDGARALYEACAAQNLGLECISVSAKLTLASVLRELGDESKAQVLYTSELQAIAARLSTSTSAASASSHSSQTKKPEPVAELEEGEVQQDDPTQTASEQLATSQLAQFVEQSASGAVSTVAPALIAAEFTAADADLALHAAWILMHRQSIWTLRDMRGGFRQHCLVLAQQDLAVAGALLEPLVNAKADLNAALRTSASMGWMLHQVKQVTLITQTKGQVTGVHQLEDQEKERCSECLRQAKAAVPQHENTLQLEAEVLALDEKLDEAIEVVESLVRRSDGGDGVPLVIKANYLAQKAFALFGLAQENEDAGLASKAEAMLKETDDLYAAALNRDKACVEAMAQSAQLKMLLGKFDEALPLLEQALPLSRSRDEVQELGQMLAQARAHVEAIKTLQTIGSSQG